MNLPANRFEQRSKIHTATISLLLVGVIGLVDYLTGYAIFFSAFYLIPVALSAWFAGNFFGIFISVLSVTVWLAGDFAAGAQYSNWLVPMWNGVIALMVYLVVVRTLVSLRRSQRELEARVRERTASLTNEIQERTRLERELLEISEREQQQIGHDLHDGLGQHLTATAFASQVLTQQLENKSLPEAVAAQNLVKLVEEAIGLTRTFARDLHPVELADEGLMDGFQELARNSGERFKIVCEFESPESLLFPDAAAGTQLYRIAQEAITNAVKHGKAKHVKISLRKNEKKFILEITDDGGGLPEKTRSGHGMGLRIMAYRANMIGGNFNIERLLPTGTRVTCSLPLENISPAKIHDAQN